LKYTGNTLLQSEVIMMSKMIIPEVEICIGENLYLQIKDVSFIPFKKGVTSALPENCYPDEPAQASWKDENCRLIIKKKEMERPLGWYQLRGIPVKMIKKEYDFDCDPALAAEYYDKIIEQIEEDLKNDQ